MSRTLRVLAIVLTVASCGGPSQAPSELDDACRIVKQRPEYLRAFRATEKKWGVPVHVQMATIHAESRFVGDARTPYRYTLGVIPMGRQSSAYGYAQALDGTWEQYLKETGRGMFARRDKIKDATDFMGWYMATTRAKNGIPLHDARRQYLAYHEGHAGYARGSYNSKSWLLRVANGVGSRSSMYQAQLATCGLRR